MALYPPPTENLPIFDESVFVNKNEPLTGTFIDGHYLRYPNAQGTENMLDTNVFGTLTVNGVTQVNGSEFITSQAPLGFSQFSVTNINGNQSISITNGCNQGAPNPIVNFAENAIISTNQNMALSVASATTSGITIAPNATLIGSGGTSFTPTCGIGMQGSTNTLTVINPTPAIYGPSTVQPPISDSSTKIPSTAWVQSLISSLPTSLTMIPYFRVSGTTNVNSNRYLTPFGFQFSGTSWNVNDFFSVRLTVSGYQPTGSNASYNFTGIFDIYPNRCPANTAYGSTSGNATTVGSSPFAQMNGSIFSGTGYVSSYNVPVDATYAPFGRYYWVSSAQITNNLGTAQQPNCLPIYPFITQTTQQTNFGFQLWATSTVTFANKYNVTAEIIGNTTNNAITSYGITQFPIFYTTF